MAAKLTVFSIWKPSYLRSDSYHKAMSISRLSYHYNGNPVFVLKWVFSGAVILRKMGLERISYSGWHNAPRQFRQFRAARVRQYEEGSRTLNRIPITSGRKNIIKIFDQRVIVYKEMYFSVDMCHFVVGIKLSELKKTSSDNCRSHTRYLIHGCVNFLRQCIKG